MSDIKSQESRSYNMSQIRGTNTKPELIVRKYLFNKGFRYRLRNNNLPGKHDLVLPKYKTVIFVNGCFWHGHDGCKYFSVPETRREFWLNKINRTKENDKANFEALSGLGYCVVTVWECELRTSELRNHNLMRLAKEISENLH